MQPSEEAIKEFQVLWKKEYGKELSYEEAAEQAHNLMRFCEVIYDSYITDCKRKARLENEPKGFSLEGRGYTCAICRGHTAEGEAWYDKYGIKCPTCQAGIDRKEIPATMAKFEDRWYSKYDMESRFNLKSPTLRKWVNAGILKSRSIKNSQGRTHVEIYLIKDNKDFLPPKKLTESQSVSEVIDGSTWVHCEPWYRFVDPFKHLKGYRIMDYLEFKASNPSE